MVVGDGKDVTDFERFIDSECGRTVDLTVKCVS